MRVFFYILIAASFCSCGSFREKFGRKKGETLLTFRVGREQSPISTIYPMYGGVMIIIKSESGTDFMKSIYVADDSAAVQLAVPNGIYKAGAIGWEGNSTPGCTPGSNCFNGQGQAKCDIANNDATFALTGGAVTIPFTLTQGKCQNPPNGPTFADVAYNPTGDTNFPAIKFHFAAGFYNTALHYGLLTLNLLTKTAAGTVKSGAVRLSCTSVAGGALPTNQAMPLGKAGDSIFSYTLTMHNSGDTNCSQTPTGVFEFPTGLATSPSSTTHTVSAFTATYSGGVNTMDFTTN
jgi:hypothetical protein